MDKNHITSFLSKQVRNMIVEIGERHLQNYCSKYMYISHRFTLKWDKIETILSISDDFCIHDQQSSWFIDKIDKLWPIFIESHSLHDCSPSNLVDMQHLYEWTSHPKEIEEYLKLFLSFNVSTTEAILFLTAVLERSLGNLCLLNGSYVPSLLRDLLTTTEMEIILGKVPVVFLQILMGTPLALNLRNIAWHGFPRQDELYPHFVSTLFVVILSVGELLLQRNTEIFTIPKRSQMQFSDILFPDSFLSVEKYHDEIFELLFQSDLIPTSHFPCWKCALEHYKNKRHGRALLILLPQVEHMLRCLYCRVNDCLDQLLTAESTTLYTTLNEIMAENITNEGVIKENKIINFLGESVIEMLQDLFVHPAGPRLRDKMSHGECNLKDIPEKLVNQLISVALVIEIKSEEQFQNKTTKEKATHLKIESKIFRACESYVSKFHPTSLLKMSIRQCLLTLNMLSIYDAQNFNNEIDMQSVKKCGRSELFSLIKQVRNHLQKNGSYSCIESVSVYVVSLKIRTVFRHKSENELVNLLRQIISNVEQICEQVAQNLQEKYRLYSQHLLRSRQRVTFQRTLCLVPVLEDILFCIICIIVINLQSVNNICSLLGKDLENLSKFCRTILQFVQNVVSLTKRDKNRWLEIQILAEKFCQTVSRKFNAPFFVRLESFSNTQ